jgi:hypothetical protein
MKNAILCMMLVFICFAMDAQTRNGKRSSRNAKINKVEPKVTNEERTFKKYSLYCGISKNYFSNDPIEKMVGFILFRYRSE